ncbi:Transmembrane domain-containing protein [Orpheovirus IHUMI-LCC2]|uniref:Transmembrane domain-containing protein n=1 Tax=Orpheovirus IHUMI-LCC2 TaxID=2023057 RepID=A0A2I2L4D6_9VIRU|nr:Transmembrane domain-containing protein [Orpheovirus IHUMI-LCC2]SNW62329.1 Transmembrane domain-containing protein [Orpheovirus IHUMI-LCC2]
MKAQENIKLNTSNIKMYRLFFIIMMASCIYGKVLIPDYDMQFPSAQITPSGSMWPKFKPVTAPLAIASADVPCAYYNGKTTLIIIEPYIDEVIIKYKECGSSAIMILGTSSIYPGTSVRYFRNAVPFTTVDEVYPVTELLSVNAKTVIELFKNVSSVNKTLPIYVTLTAEEGNIWKDSAYGGGMLSQVTLLGAIYLAVGIWCTINIFRMFEYEMPHLKVPVILSALVGFGSYLRTGGFVDYQGWRQLGDYVAASFFSHAGIGFIFSACWFMSLLMLNMVDRSNINVKLMINRYMWPYIIITVIRVSLDWVFSLVTCFNLTSGSYLLTSSIIWTTVSAGMDLSLAVIFVISFIKVLRARARGIEMGNKRNKYDRSLLVTVFINFGIAFFIICYFVLSLIAWFGLAGYPDRVFLFYFVQPMLLSFIALLLTISIHLRITQHIKSSYTKSPMSSDIIKTNTNTNSNNTNTGDITPTSNDTPLNTLTVN